MSESATTVVLTREASIENQLAAAPGHPFPPAIAGSPPFSPAKPRLFGKFELLKEVGRGGMGVVFRARESGLGRTVALKVLLIDSAEDANRFRRETQAVARLRHPNIAAIHEVGCCEDRLYYTMDFIEGPTLAQRLQSGPLAQREAATHVQTLAEAVHYAHTHNILHRDLKPANVLLKPATFCDMPSPLSVARVDGIVAIPVLTDFGLAKDMSVNADKTQSGTIVGTAYYMAPEQAAGRIHDQGPATDVWGLGALLYEMISGQLPFPAGNVVDAARCIIEVEPVPPRQHDRAIAPDLEAICLKCLEKDPRDRYPSAQALADDVGRYLVSEPVTVRQRNFLDRLVRILAFDNLAAQAQAWGSALLALAALSFVTQMTLFALAMSRPTHFGISTVSVHAIDLGLMIAVLASRYRCLAPRCAADRQLWTIWLGFLAACVLAAVLEGPTLGPVSVAAELRLYPIWAVLSGFAFLVTGASFWGRAYVYGLAFFVLAIVLPVQGPFAPLSFGLVWAATLLDVGTHLRRNPTRAASRKA